MAVGRRVPSLRLAVTSRAPRGKSTSLSFCLSLPPSLAPLTISLVDGIPFTITCSSNCKSFIRFQTLSPSGEKHPLPTHTHTPEQFQGGRTAFPETRDLLSGEVSLAGTPQRPALDYPRPNSACLSLQPVSTHPSGQCLRLNSTQKFLTTSQDRETFQGHAVSFIF